MSAPRPSRDGGGTTTPTSGCPVCGTAFLRRGRQAYCSTACRKRAFRRRHAARVTPIVPAGSRRAHMVYECGECGQRRLGEQRCTDCGVFGRAVGLGGACPSCGEPVTLADLDLEAVQ